MLEKLFPDAARIGLFWMLVGLSVALATTADGWAAEAGMLHLRCTNPIGGARWSTVVDLDRHLVDSQPATITDTAIKWRDAHGGIYEYDRATGKLELRGASTTGGFFFHYTCQQE